MDDGGSSKTGCCRTKLEVKARIEGSRQAVDIHLLGLQKMFGSLCLLAVLHSSCHIDLAVRLRREAVCVVKPCVENNARQPFAVPVQCGVLEFD
jgi:hypothetical protein